jgi:hypothetical protein
MDNGAMVLASEKISDIRKRGAGKLTAKVHGNLAGQNNRSGAPFGLEV